MEQWLKSVTEQPGATVDLYIRDAVWPSVALKKLVGARVEVTDEDLRRGYESNYGERVEAQAIVFSDQRQAQKVWDMARNNNTEPMFTELAQQYSIEPSSRSNGGKVPPIRRFGGSPLIEDEAFKLKAGDLSGIVSVDGQFIILRCMGGRSPVQNEFKDGPQRAGQRHPGEETPDADDERIRPAAEVAQVDNISPAPPKAAAAPPAPSPSFPTASPPPAGALPSAPGKAGAGIAPASAALPRTNGPQPR